MRVFEFDIGSTKLMVYQKCFDQKLFHTSKSDVGTFRALPSYTSSFDPF